MNIPPYPKTKSQEMAAQQMSTLPAPPDVPAEIVVEEAINVRAVLASEKPPTNEEWTKLREKVQEIGVSRPSRNNLEQDAAIAVSNTEIERLRKDFDSRLPGTESGVSITSMVQGIKKATGMARVMLVLGGVFEIVRWLAPFVHDILKGN